MNLDLPAFIHVMPAQPRRGLMLAWIPAFAGMKLTALTEDVNALAHLFGRQAKVEFAPKD